MSDERSALLVARYVDDKDQDAFRELYETHARFVRSFARKFAGIPLERGETRGNTRLDHLCQEIWAVVARKAEKFDRTKDFRAWVLGIARNEAKREGRDQARHWRNDRPLAQEPLDHHEREDLALFRVDLGQAMAVLSFEERDAIHMKFFEGKTNRAIARKLGLAEATVVTRLNTALEKLRPLMAAWKNVRRL